VKPYWQSEDGLITVYNADYLAVLAAGVVPVRDVALIHDDPHYGVNEDTARGSKGRGIGGTLTSGKYANSKRIAHAKDFPRVVGDDKPFDARALLALERPTVIWGGHLCEPALPRSKAWIIWDKRDGTTPDDNGDCEMAWTNLPGPIREFRHLWRGTCRASETGVPHLHGTQKPIALSTFVFRRAKLKRGDLVLVPHGGSGPDLPACVAMGLRLIWCDVERWCCDTAISRLGGITAERAAEAPGPLFAGLTASPDAPSPRSPTGTAPPPSR
jgi:site-specific DNA-methyltransferase (adenine-specific)/modification methylase